MTSFASPSNYHACFLNDQQKPSSDVVLLRGLLIMSPDIHVLTQPSFSFGSKPEEYAASPVPSLQEFEQLWAAWNLVTRHMIPQEEILSKPIKLRNACIFYLGHIPAFLDIHLTRATGQMPTQPAFYHQMFERGIDPDVDNPEHCHAHSEIPDEWPPLEEILEYQERVRARARLLYKQTNFRDDRKFGRAIWLGFEHEGKKHWSFIGSLVDASPAAMHLETLLYMLLQSDKTLPPPGKITDFEALAREAEVGALSREWIRVPQQSLKVGVNDPEDDKGPDRYFGWDNEKPQRTVEVPAFEVKAGPLTNGDYARFLEQTDEERVPSSWVVVFGSSSTGLNRPFHTNGYDGTANGPAESVTDAFLAGKYVRTVYGRVPLKHALHWPVFASYDELASCTKWMNGRIPTADEVRSIHNYVEVSRLKEADSILTRKISAVNGYVQPPKSPH